MREGDSGMPAELIEFAKAHEVLTAGVAGGACGLLASLVTAVFSRWSAAAAARAVTEAAEKQAAATLASAERQALAIVSAAAEQASATREAALRSAFETERMKLRYDLARRHVESFHEKAGALLAILEEAKNDASVAARLIKGPPHAHFNACFTGEIAATTHYFELMRETASRFCEHYSNAALLFKKHGVDPDIRPDSVSRVILLECMTAAYALRAIIAGVDIAVEARASQTDVDEARRGIRHLMAMALETEKYLQTLFEHGLAENPPSS